MAHPTVVVSWDEAVYTLPLADILSDVEPGRHGDRYGRSNESKDGSRMESQACVQENNVSNSQAEGDFDLYGGPIDEHPQECV